MTLPLHVSREGARAERIRPEQWQPFYELREAGLVPRRGFVRVSLDRPLTVARAMVVPPGENPWQLDFSPVAGLDVFLIFDGNETSAGRLSHCIGALLRHDPASLQAIDATPGMAPRWAYLKKWRPRDE